jgi:hypothetical protein
VLQQLNIQSGDHLIVAIQDDMIVLLPQPQNYSEQLQGLHWEIWEGVDTDNYIYKSVVILKIAESMIRQVADTRYRCLL